MNPVLDLSSRLTVLPAVYGSGDFALQIRRRLRQRPFDCLAVALPPSLGPAVEAGVAALPRISVAVQAEVALDASYSYVPIDPCQAVIAAVREAMDSGVERAYVDLEVGVYEPQTTLLPDPYALKNVQLEKFLAALLPVLPAPEAGSQRAQRIRRMAHELHCLELDFEHVVFVCSVADWPWIRQAYTQRLSFADHFTGPSMPQLFGAAEETLFFVLGELPFITHLYEHRRAELMSSGDESLFLDGVKALLLEARSAWASRLEVDREGSEGLSPQLLRTLLKYVRNLTLLDRRLTPDLYSLAMAAKQVVGDDFALAVIETSRQYPPQRLPSPQGEQNIAMGIGLIADADGEARPGKDRLEGSPRIWRALPLKPSLGPPRGDSALWRQQWNPFGQCSHAPEDRRIESFQQSVRERALALAGEEPRIEKFTSSLKDGLDLRESLRNWHSGDLFVKELPPARGKVEVVVFLFEASSAGDEEERFSWRSTWYAEHAEESTLCFFATPFVEHMVGPGIGQSVYGGCLFLFPPRHIPDIWTDSRFDGAESVQERLLMGALFHSREKRVVLVAPASPSRRWRRLARLYHRQLLFIPLRRFSPVTIDRLRRFHVLNGRHVRSYASRFIRDMR